MSKKVLVDVQLLLELKTGILEAIYSEDGLDGADGVYLLSGINLALGLPVEDQSPPPNNPLQPIAQAANDNH